MISALLFLSPTIHYTLSFFSFFGPIGFIEFGSYIYHVLVYVDAGYDPVIVCFARCTAVGAYGTSILSVISHCFISCWCSDWWCICIGVDWLYTVYIIKFEYTLNLTMTFLHDSLSCIHCTLPSTVAFHLKSSFLINESLLLQTNRKTR